MAGQKFGECLDCRALVQHVFENGIHPLRFIWVNWVANSVTKRIYDFNEIIIVCIHRDDILDLWDSLGHHLRGRDAVFFTADVSQPRSIATQALPCN